MEVFAETPPSLPTLPDDLISEIFARSDGKTVGRGRTLSTFWRDMLVSDDFVCMHLFHVKARSTASFVHFGMKGPRAIGSWVIRFNADSGNREALKMPFLRNNQGKIEVVGSEHGNIALRYVSDGMAPGLIVWNPTTCSFSRIDDPMHHAGLFGTCAYAFSYIPRSLDYLWLYIYKQSIVDQHCCLTVYSTVSKSWEIEVTCSIYVQVLDPKYVVHKGEVYWISWNSRGVTRPQCIIRYSIAKREFNYILIPAPAQSNMTRLLAHFDELCFATVQRAEGGYRWLLWINDEEEGTHSWRLWTEYFGVGSAEYPECFSGEDIITIQETNQPRNWATNIVGTRINICRVNPNTNTRRAIQFEAAPSPFHVNSLTLNVESIVPVEGSHA
ncbi:hypothetical protein PIB30_028677 [Stylosanthes scabra]|uniref:F-box associated beta-propeller type 1 domain-containing protein n=1 Tax=Stylosanthes scabra TaxID=79078 RepID=A0ABU6SB99_9FABA|nr:hypothetical protein [Stylosanthes scabra]